MKTKKKHSPKTSPLSPLLVITSVILGALSIFLYMRVQSLNGETHTLLQKHQVCEESMSKLSDCTGELSETKEFQAELEKRKDLAEKGVDSLQNELITMKQKFTQQKKRTIRPKQSINRQKELATPSPNEKEIEYDYNQKVMTDLLKAQLK